jgi:hypothetical protein
MRAMVLAGCLMAGGFGFLLCWSAGGEGIRPAAVRAAPCAVECSPAPHPEQSRAARFARVFQD